MSRSLPRFSLVLLIVFALFVFAGCAEQTRAYLGYRLAPHVPPTNKTIEIPAAGLPEAVAIYLDDYGVPHIQARDEYSLYYAFGYMEGRDRRFELEMFKMVAAGRLRELIGENDQTGVMTKLEIFSRMIGLYRDAQALVDSLPPEDLRLLQAFSDGINAATARETRPLEFRLLNYQPEPWRPYDSGLIIALVRFGLCKDWEMELGRLELYLYQLQTGADLDRAMAIWPVRYEMGPFLIGDKQPQDPFAAIPPIAPELVDYLKEFAREHPLDLQHPPVAPDKHAAYWSSLSCSNNWAIDGQWTGTGKAALCSDPHMPHFLPSMAYLSHLKCADCPTGAYEVIGGSFVGLPAISFGTNGKVAWGATSNWADVTDLYVEKPAPGKPDFYLREGKEIPFQKLVEEFKIRQQDGSFRTETYIVRATDHGVILNDFTDRLPADFPLVALHRDLAWGRPISALRGVYLSANVDQAREAMLDFTAMIGHWAIADDGGNILYVGTVNLPKRTRHLGSTPVPGWVDDYDWTTMIPPGDLPYIKNPPFHFIGTANNQVIHPETTAYPITLSGDVPHRSGRIFAELGKGSDGSPVAEQMRRLHLDNIDLGWEWERDLYTRALTPLLNDQDKLVARAAKLLLEWDGTNDPRDVAPGLFQSLNAYLLENTLVDEMSRASLDYQLHFFNAEPLVFNILRHPDNPAWDDRRTPEVERAETVIAASFRQAVAAMRDRYGKRLTGWKWNKVSPTVFTHPFGEQKGLQRYLNRKVKTSGSANTVDKHQFMRAEMTYFPVKYGPVMRVNIDLNDLSASMMSLPGGQSGLPSSKHYDDQLPLYLKGKGLPMTLGFDQWEQKAAGKLLLKP